MKVFLYLLSTAAIVLLLSCTSDDNSIIPEELPQQTKESFANKFPNAQDVEWEKEGEYLEAEFEVDGMEKSVLYDSNGNIVEVETEIEIEDLLSSIKDYIESNYSSFSIEEAEKIENDEGVFYEVELEKGELEVELLFDDEGSFIRKEEENEDDDENGEDDENEREISKEDIPQVVLDALNEKYPNAEILEADEVTRDDGSITYDIEIKFDGKVIEVMYDAKGNFLGIEKDEEED